MPPKFAVSVPKCSRCNLSVYPMEQTTYDNRLYHQSCFKCLECKSALSLSRIACINNDLYCKTCFMRIFTKDGKYAAFGGAAAEARRATVSGPAPGPTSPGSDGESSSVTPLHHRTMTGVTATNIVATRTASLSVFSRPTDSTPSSSSSSSSSSSLVSSSDPILASLFDAIAARNTEKSKEIVNTNGIELLFKTNNRNQTPIEVAFSGFNTKSIGNMFLNLLSTRLGVNTNGLLSGTVSPAALASPPLSPTSNKRELDLAFVNSTATTITTMVTN